MFGLATKEFWARRPAQNRYGGFRGLLRDAIG
jgi:hypothetical protein